MLWLFGDCRVDVLQREFHRRGKPEHLTPKAFDLLVTLIEQRPQVIDKETLIHRVWPDTFVADANLAILIAEIRAAIGDSAREPRFIRTVHRRGYAFIGGVTEQPRRSKVPLAGPVAVLRVGTRRILLDRGDLTVGRDPACDIVINDVSISRKHAVLSVKKDRVLVSDESKNGTRVRGNRVRAATALASGDVISFGNIDAEFTIELPSEVSTLTTDAPDE